MKRIWEECWEQPRHKPSTQFFLDFDAEEGARGGEACFATGADGRGTERAALARQAPAMARLLLEAEWSGFDTHDFEPGGYDACPWCERWRAAGHKPGCRFIAVLLAAGVLTAPHPPDTPK